MIKKYLNGNDFILENDELAKMKTFVEVQKQMKNIL